MYELYKIADKLLAELKRIEKSGAPKRTVQEYSIKIIDYLDEKTRK